MYQHAPTYVLIYSLKDADPAMFGRGQQFLFNIYLFIKDWSKLTLEAVTKITQSSMNS